MSARPTDADLPARVRELATPLAEPLGVDLVDVEVKGPAGRRVVRLVADHLDPASGLDIDTIAALSRGVGDKLDEVDLIAGAYTLEVTSPGVTRPLRRERDFARNVGRKVEVVRRDDLDGPRTVRGDVVGVADEVVVLRTGDGEQQLPLDEIDHATVVLPW